MVFLVKIVDEENDVLCIHEFDKERTTKEKVREEYEKSFPNMKIEVE